MHPLFRMIRPGNVVMAGGSVWLAAWIGGADLGQHGLWLDGVALGLLAALGNLHNDLVDLPVDQVNRPERPLPSGLVSSQQVWSVILLGLCLLVILGLLRDVPHGIFFVVVAVLLFVYNRWLKGWPVVGNLAVALLCASALWVPLLDQQVWSTGSHPEWLWPLVGFSFLFTWVRELVKDVEDMAGDGCAHLKTLPLLIGKRRSLVVAQGLLFLCVGSILLPWMRVIYPFAFVVVCVLTVLPWVGRAWLALRSKNTTLRVAQKSLKMAMVGGLVASILVFRLFPVFGWL